MFAHDIAKCADIRIRLQKQLNNISVNLNKTEIIVFRNGGPLRSYESFTFNGIPVKTTSEYKYLGLIFTPKLSWSKANRLRAKKGPAPPSPGNFADISYLEENFKPHLLRDVCTLCSGALVSDSLLHMLL